MPRKAAATPRSELIKQGKALVSAGEKVLKLAERTTAVQKPPAKKTTPKKATARKTTRKKSTAKK